MTVWWQEGCPARKNPVPLIPRGSLPKQVEKRGHPSPEGNRLIEVHLKKVVKRKY